MQSPSSAQLRLGSLQPRRTRSSSRSAGWPVRNSQLLYDGVPMAMAGDAVKLSKGYGQCYVTGMEKVTLVSFPR